MICRGYHSFLVMNMSEEAENTNKKSQFFIFLFIDIFKEGSLISDPALLSHKGPLHTNTNTTRFKNYKQDTLEYIPNGKITKESIKIAYKAQVILPIK